MQEKRQHNFHSGVAAQDCQTTLLAMPTQLNGVSLLHQSEESVAIRFADADCIVRATNESITITTESHTQELVWSGFPFDRYRRPNSNVMRRAMYECATSLMTVSLAKNAGSWSRITAPGWIVSAVADVILRAFVAQTPKPCPNCGRWLRTPKAQQCFHCGSDWHGTS